MADDGNQKVGQVKSLSLSLFLFETHRKKEKEKRKSLDYYSIPIVFGNKIYLNGFSLIRGETGVPFQ